jgi:hypothetical protein
MEHGVYLLNLAVEVGYAECCKHLEKDVRICHIGSRMAIELPI